MFETLLAAFVASAFGAAAYLYQKRVDRSEALIEKRREAYETMLEALYHYDPVTHTKPTKEYDLARISMSLLASDKVLEALAMVHEGTCYDGSGIGPVDLNQRTVDMVFAMREDVFEATEVAVSDLEYVVPVGSYSGKSNL